MKLYYLPPVLESNARKGYLAPDVETMLAAILVHGAKLVRVKGLLFKKPAEKICGFANAYYPIDVKCIENKCMAIDPIENKAIMDHGVIGSIAFMLQHPSLSPYISSYIEIAAPDSTYSLDMYSEEYSMPPLRTGPARYYVAYNAYLICNEGHRTVIEPPLYYMVGYPTTKNAIRAFSALRKFAERARVNEVELINRMLQSRSYLSSPATRKSVENGLKKLHELKLVSPGDVLFVTSAID